MGLFQKIKVHKTIYFVWAVFLIGLLILQHTELTAAVLEYSGYIRLIEVCILTGIVLAYKAIRSIAAKCSSYQTGVMIFAAALIVRILSLPFCEYVPTNDFANYYEGACHFAEHGFSGGMYEPLTTYGIYTFAGQAVINGFLLRIFSPTLLGMQVLNCIYTAGICLMIYVLGKKIDSSAGIMGACMYTFYPMGVLSVHITTNVHGAVFFMLLGIYFFEKAQETDDGNRLAEKAEKTQKMFAVRKRILETAACALSLSVSNLYHPSVIIVLCGLAVYTAGCEINQRIRMGRAYKKSMFFDIRHFRGRLAVTAAVLIFYGVVSGGILWGIVNSGYMESTVKFSYLSKIVYGLNYEHDGAWNKPDEERISACSSEDMDRECMRMIKERLKDPWKVVRLLIKKTRLAWFGPDNYDYFYMDGILQRYGSCAEGITSRDAVDTIRRRQETACSNLWSISSADQLFVYVIWILAVIGILALLKKQEEENIAYLLLYIPLGWMAYIMIGEMQSRYRYQGMTVIILMAGYGAVMIGRTFRAGRCICQKRRMAGYGRQRSCRTAGQTGAAVRRH